MSANVSKSFVAWFEELGLDDVRSSATDEDTKAASFAGMNRPFTNVHRGVMTCSRARLLDLIVHAERLTNCSWGHPECR